MVGFPWREEGVCCFHDVLLVVESSPGAGGRGERGTMWMKRSNALRGWWVEVFCVSSVSRYWMIGIRYLCSVK